MNLYIILLLVLIIKSPSRDKDHSVLIRILTSYFQVILYVKDLDLSWPESVTKLLEALSFVSSST